MTSLGISSGLFSCNLQKKRVGHDSSMTIRLLQGKNYVAGDNVSIAHYGGFAALSESEQNLFKFLFVYTSYNALKIQSADDFQSLQVVNLLIRVLKDQDFGSREQGQSAWLLAQSNKPEVKNVLALILKGSKDSDAYRLVDRALDEKRHKENKEIRIGNQWAKQ